MKELKITLLSLLLFVPFISNAQWIQIGNDIDGIEEQENSGNAVSINSDGTVMALGAFRNDTNGALSGQARVYDFNGSDWTQKGNFITGNTAGDNLGQSLDLNADGTTIIVGAPAFSSSPATPGYAKVLTFDGTNWVQRGIDILGTAARDTFGNSVSISDDGNIIAIGAEANPNLGYVRIFEWDGNNYNQIGNDINAELASTGFARSVSLNADGTILAVGAVSSDVNDNDTGLVRLFEWNGTNWTQKGNDIIGEAEGDFFGSGVRLNASGTIVSAGARDSSNQSAGYGLVLEWNGTDWIQKGSKMTGFDGDFFANSGDVNAAGDIVIYGTILGDYVRILKFDGTDWVAVGDDIQGEAPADQFGIAVAINGLGETIAVGARGNDASGAQSGHVRVFENLTLGVDDMTLNSLSFYPNPVSNKLTINTSEIIQNITIYSVLGQHVFSSKENNQNVVLDVSSIAAGNYIVKVQTAIGVESIKLIKK